MNPQPFQGVWSYRSGQFPDYDDLMWIDEVGGRIITFVLMTAAPLQYHSTRYWYRSESPNSISATLDLKSEWRVHQFVLQDDTLIWTYGGREHAWKRLSPDEYPEWLEAKVTKAYSKMDEVERRA